MTALRGSLRNVRWRPTLLVTMTLVALTLSAGFTIYAACYNKLDLGARGGAIGVALTFLMFFIGKDVSKDALETRLSGYAEAEKDNHPDRTIFLNKERSTQAHNAMGAFLDWSGFERWWLAAASFISTIFWGFGDWFAEWLVPYVCVYNC